MRFVFIFFISVVFLACNTTGRPDSQGESNDGDLIFENPGYSFGQVNSGDVVGHIFKCVNKGDGKVKILSVEETCECISSKVHKSIVKPNESGAVEVVFDTKGWRGKEVKRIIVFSNGNKNRHELILWADIQ